ncbi:MAG: serine/threonine-protein kinase, partial [Cyanobacteria bacterium P01_E01_bin.35]
QNPHNSDTTIFCQGCGSELLLDGRYRVLQELGQGGFGTTFEIIDVNARPWVLKVLMDNHPKYVELFAQEAQVLSLLKHHGIPKIDLDGYFLYFPEGKEEPLHCLVMEKIEGLNLSQYIKQRGDRPIKPKRVLRWLAELALILEQVHGQHFFHRDIKPSNIMLRANGCLALIDFGTARELTDSYLLKKAAGEITGVVTQGYTPMEQMRGKAVLQSDFYALGGTLIYLLTAQNPSSFYDFTADRVIWRHAVPQIAPEFADLIDSMMEFSPAKRPSNSREIFNRVIAIDSSLQILDEHFNFNTTNSQLNTRARTNINNYTSASSNTAFSSTSNTAFLSSFNTPITPEFVERCRQQLAEVIGPMASIICKRAIQKNPNMTESELALALAKTISNPQQSRDFQQKLLK